LFAGFRQHRGEPAVPCSGVIQLNTDIGQLSFERLSAIGARSQVFNLRLKFRNRRLEPGHVAHDLAQYTTGPLLAVKSQQVRRPVCPKTGIMLLSTKETSAQ